MHRFEVPDESFVMCEGELSATCLEQAEQRASRALASQPGEPSRVIAVSNPTSDEAASYFWPRVTGVTADAAPWDFSDYLAGRKE